MIPSRDKRPICQKESFHVPLSELTCFTPLFFAGIFLKSFPVRPGELKDKLFIVNEEDGGLSDGHITSLRRYGLVPRNLMIYRHSLLCSRKGERGQRLFEPRVVDGFFFLAGTSNLETGWFAIQRQKTDLKIDLMYCVEDYIYTMKM